jgi:hypothetical protein
LEMGPAWRKSGELEQRLATLEAALADRTIRRVR